MLNSPSLQLTEVRRGGRSVVYRQELAEGGTVIRKQITDGGERGFNDWASLEFLGEVPEAAGLVPRFLGGDAAEKVFLMEDLGGSVSLEEVLNGKDLTRAHQVLRELARAYARLHGATLGRESGFDRRRSTLPGAPLHRAGEAEAWLRGRPMRRDWHQALLGTALPPGFCAACERIARLYAEPGPHLAFTHGDPAPTNTHLRGEEVRLLDFEYGAYRHALYDLTAWQILCPLPLPILGEMVQAYRAELALKVPAAADTAAFQEQWAAVCAYRALAMLTWVRPALLETDHPWAPGWTARQALLTAMTRTALATHDIPWLQPVHQAAAQLQTALEHRFPNLIGQLPPWAALS